MLFAYQTMWLGLTSNDGGKTFLWSDGTDVDYLPWGAGCPRNISISCVVTGGYYFYNSDCNISEGFVCKRPAQ